MTGLDAVALAISALLAAYLLDALLRGEEL
jgi:K+-transporting ATPase KdpF subunit